MKRQWCSRLTHALIVIALTFGGLPALRLTAAQSDRAARSRDTRCGIGRDGDTGSSFCGRPDRTPPSQVVTD
jgi:hypothetical protein